MNESTLPAAPLLSAYWLNSELTNTFPCPTLRNIPCYTKANGSAQIGVVYLVGAAFLGSPSDFTAPYLTFAPSLLNMLENGNVGLLQSAGIKVLLSIQGSNSNGNTMGWSTLTATQSQAFASWLQTDVVEKYGLDGVDIDDEYSGAPPSAQQLVNTVAWIRNALPNSLITKALWGDTTNGDFTTAANSSPLSGQKLASLLSFGSTMGYGSDVEPMQAAVESYTSLGMPYSKLCVGIQAGPQGGSMTSLETTQTLAAWVTQKGLLGMMMWSYSQDISEFTTAPQYTVPYMSPTDHLWQQTIITTWGSSADWVVDSASLKGIYFPEGDFYLNSRNIQLILTAELQQDDGTWTGPLKIDILGFDNANLASNDGSFAKSETMLSSTEMTSIKTGITKHGLGDFVPVGSYYKSARNITVTLAAQCQTTAQQWTNSTLDLSKATYATTNVKNINGVLTLTPVT
jgi:hypothetical protein